MFRGTTFIPCFQDFVRLPFHPSAAFFAAAVAVPTLPKSIALIYMAPAACACDALPVPVRLQSNLRKMGFLKVSQPGISELFVLSDTLPNLLSVKSCFPTPLFHRLYSVVRCGKKGMPTLPVKRYITLVYLIAGKCQEGIPSCIEKFCRLF